MIRNALHMALPVVSIDIYPVNTVAFSQITWILFPCKVKIVLIPV